MTPEQIADRNDVWQRVRRLFPAFTEAHDPVNNYHAVREIVLGGSFAWAGAHLRFQPVRGMKVMDIGANTGLYSAYCGVHGARVTAYEPFPTVFSIMSEMIKKTGLSDLVEPVNAAIWTHTGQTSYVGNVSKLDDVCPAYNGGLHVEGVNWLAQEHLAQPVRCVSFSDALGWETWDCVKMDVEGAEFEILLNTPEEALRRIRFMYVEFHPWAGRSLHDRTITRLAEIFNFCGVSPSPDGRWQAAYLTQK